MKLYNTLTRSIENFDPIEEDVVTIYTCGPTVYDRLHIGNWVSYIRWDTLIRILLNAGFKPKRVLNITDVGHLTSDADEGEDKLQKGAKREGKSAWEVAEKYQVDFKEGMQELNLLTPDIYAKATDHIKQQIELISTLEKKGYTYRISDGIYFDVSKFPKYGEFAKLDLGDSTEHGRIKKNPEKRQPQDFALWKFSSDSEKRDMEWDSPWGKGFPGWHIECSAMAIEYLGSTIDIHTGGIDHIPVHHTNEIAQSEAATGKKFANYWLHNNFLLVDGAKISKSLGNSISVDEITSRGYSLLDFKMFVLQSHYRSEANFTWEGMEAARSRLNHLRTLADLRWQLKPKSQASKHLSGATDQVVDALENDMNTPLALSILSQSIDEVIASQSINVKQFEEFLETLDKLFGFNLLPRKDLGTHEKRLIVQREEARSAKNWGKADEIRHQLKTAGVEINDTEAGPIWTRPG